MEPERHTLTQAVKAEALRLGFTLVGVTAPDPLAHYPDFESWLARGFHGKMDYLASEHSRQRRADPHVIMPECQSILVLGIPYYSNQDELPGSEYPGSSPGRIASYAWGNDYHDVLPGRLLALVQFLEGHLGHSIPNRWYTDTGPLLERELAWRAGLGWVGKNTCLINPHQGSYFLLAEILLGVELEPDAPFPTDHCGTCTRCVAACPTGCILPDRTLDASRCISYLTIELKDAIPIDLRPRLGDWVFGCDVCQQVCPWNQRFAPAGGDAVFSPRQGVPRPDLIQEVSLTSERFRQKFKGSPVKRARRSGYLRNATVALGNIGSALNTAEVPEPGAGRSERAARLYLVVEALATALTDSEPIVRRHAGWALGQIGGEAAYQALFKASQHENDPGVLDEVRQALESRGV